MNILNKLKGKDSRTNYTLDETCFVYIKKEIEKWKIKEIAEVLTNATGIRRTTHSVGHKINWLRKFESFDQVYSFYDEQLSSEQDIFERSNNIEKGKRV